MEVENGMKNEIQNKQNWEQKVKGVETHYTSKVEKV